MSTRNELAKLDALHVRQLAQLADFGLVVSYDPVTEGRVIVEGAHPPTETVRRYAEAMVVADIVTKEHQRWLSRN